MEEHDDQPLRLPPTPAEWEATQEELRTLRLQVRDTQTCVQDLRDLLAEQDQASSRRAFIIGARARLKAYEERWAEKRVCEHKWSPVFDAKATVKCRRCGELQV